jgi:hypothetical protein
MTTSTATPSVAHDTVTAYHGKLAVQIVGYTDWETPNYVQSYFVSNLKAIDWEDILGLRWNAFPTAGPNIGYVCNAVTGREIRVDLTGWELVREQTPIAKPRDGKEHTWTWRNGKWSKELFPRCPECRTYHNPELSEHCEVCDTAHAPGKPCKSPRCR